jgi:ADP-ribose pyrophosphatase YjhB (NUDIX family)
MSYVSGVDIEMTERLYGKPQELSVEISINAKEYARINSSRHNGRAHDVTVFITHGDKLLFIAKHFYPKTLFRAPSGGAMPGESLIDGAIRETREETGVEIELQRYLLRIRAKFVDRQNAINWTSHIFKACYLSGEIKPTDTNEIREARLVDRSELAKFNEIFMKVNTGGFRYRAFLTENVMKILDSETKLPTKDLDINQI